jgi:ABC-type branched-subunit amino acid transport system ATPase component
VAVLHAIDLRLEPGTITLLVGANGAGKSTLAGVLGGLVPPSAGSVRLTGADVTAVPAHRRARDGLVVLPESRGVFPGLTVDDNLALWLRTADQRDEAFDRFPVLRERHRLLAQNLSGGEQQMVTVAAATVRPPVVLVADEPTLGLAPRVVADVIAGFAALRDAGVAVLLIEEKAGPALAVADSVAILELGRITWAGAPADLEEEQLAEIHVGRVLA